MGKKEEKVVSVPQPSMQRRTGYIAIFKGSSYGERTLSYDTVLYEFAKECRDDNEKTEDFLDVAAVTWEEAA